MAESCTGEPKPCEASCHLPSSASFYSEHLPFLSSALGLAGPAAAADLKWLYPSVLRGVRWELWGWALAVTHPRDAEWLRQSSALLQQHQELSQWHIYTSRSGSTDTKPSLLPNLTPPHQLSFSWESHLQGSVPHTTGAAASSSHTKNIQETTKHPGGHRFNPATGWISSNGRVWSEGVGKDVPTAQHSVTPQLGPWAPGISQCLWQDYRPKIPTFLPAPVQQAVVSKRQGNVHKDMSYPAGCHCTAPGSNAHEPLSLQGSCWISLMPRRVAQRGCRKMNRYWTCT